jgi:hypothetical protein
MYGCELWDLESENIQPFSCAWRSALGRLLGLPFNSHCFILPILTYTLPVFDEICKRSARFIASCLYSRSQLVRAVAWYGVMYGRYNSVIGKNFLFCCNRFGWCPTDYGSCLANLHNVNFSNFCVDRLEQKERDIATFLMELILLREGYSEFVSNSSFLSKQDINFMISYVSSS